MTKRILSGLIAVLTVLFFFVYAAAAQYLIAILALVFGFVWLRLQDDQEQTLPALFFLFFLGLALVGTIAGAPALVLLIGVCADLAAWDLARFRARFSRAGDGEIDGVLEMRHLQRLFAPIGIGLLIAIPATMVSIPTNFLIFLALVLLVMLVLRASVLHLRQPQE